MKIIIGSYLLPFVCLLAASLCGCTTAAHKYATQHPELSGEQRRMFATGQIPHGTAVAGLTREQVRLIMGSDPAQFARVEGEDVWVWVRDRLSTAPPSDDFGGDQSASPGRGGREGGGGGRRRGAGGQGAASPERKSTRTAVFFEGDIAIRADVGEGGL